VKSATGHLYWFFPIVPMPKAGTYQHRPASDSAWMLS
jgi:hypothetical protein